VILCESATFTANDLPSEIKASARSDSSFTIHLGSSVREVVDELIWRTVAYAGGNKVRAAKILGAAAARFTAALNVAIRIRRTAARTAIRIATAGTA
jgi:DNA-binding NtrC family response regulator